MRRVRLLVALSALVAAPAALAIPRPETGVASEGAPPPAREPSVLLVVVVVVAVAIVAAVLWRLASARAAKPGPPDATA